MNISNCVRFDSVKIWTNWSDRYGMYVRCTQFNGFKVTLIERVREKRTKSKNHQQRIVCPTTYNERGFFLFGLTEKKIRSFVRFLKVKYAQCITCLYCVEKPVLLLNLNAHAILYYYYTYFSMCCNFLVCLYFLHGLPFFVWFVELRWKYVWVRIFTRAVELFTFSCSWFIKSIWQIPKNIQHDAARNVCSFLLLFCGSV